MINILNKSELYFIQKTFDIIYETKYYDSVLFKKNCDKIKKEILKFIFSYLNITPNQLLLDTIENNGENVRNIVKDKFPNISDLITQILKLNSDEYWDLEIFIKKNISFKLSTINIIAILLNSYEINSTVNVLISELDDSNLLNISQNYYKQIISALAYIGYIKYIESDKIVVLSYKIPYDIQISKILSNNKQYINNLQRKIKIDSFLD
jgi:hypothetical protein